jgi:plasmid stabilization system protein ParE
MNVVWTPMAIDRIVEIGACIRRDNAVAADLWIRRIFDRVLQLERFPKSGRRVPEVARADLREIVWGNYRIIHRVERTRIAILTVRHVKQILPLGDLA